MAKGKVHHWKHGWIPLDAFALAEVAKKDDGHVKTTRRPKDSFKTAPLPPVPGKKTRKPPNYVPPADNVPKWKPPTVAEHKKAVEAELKKQEKIDALNKRRAARGEGPVGRGAPRQLPQPDLAGGGFTVEHKDGVFTIKDRKGVWVGSYKTRSAATAKLEKLGDPEGHNKVIDAQVSTSAAEMRRERYRTLDTVDGVDFVTYKDSAMDPMGTEHGNPAKLTHEQQQILADAYNEVKAEFPKMEPVQIVGVDGKTGAFGITSWDGRRISISTDTFDPAKVAYAKKQWTARDGENHGAIAGDFVDDPEAFARAVMTHELGHALEMQSTTAKLKGNRIAMERVKPADVDLPLRPGDDPNLSAPRWAVDTLGQRSFYAIGNEYEWFAEAFADAWFGGDMAQPQSKRVLAMLKDVYSTKGAAA